MSAEKILILLAGLQLKHLLADYFLQSTYMVLNKGKYLHPGGLMHAGLHAVFTMGVIMVAGSSPLFALAIGLAEFFVHYHIDWVKEAVSKKLGLAPDKVQFWMVHGTDQAAHQLTYVAIIAWLAL